MELIINDKKTIRGDRIIAFAVMIQSVLLFIQTILISVFHMYAEATTIYRVVLTAIPMIIAMFIAIIRKPVRFFVAYSIVIILLVFSVGLHPQNEPFILSQGLRFLLPVVLPSFLCLTVVSNYTVVERTLYQLSWVSVFLVLFYIIAFFNGVFMIDSYNMPFSYACLLPMVVMYSHRKVIDLITCIILFVSVLAIGARGPALYFSIFVLIDLFQHKSKWRFVILILIVVVILSLPAIYRWLSTVGLHSRTLEMFLYGDITQDSGRSSIQGFFIGELLEHPWLGLGLFGDRTYGDVPYCHNLILEVFVDFGIFLGFFIIVFGLIKLISLYVKSNMEDRNSILKYFCALVLPFMTSSSYLIDSNLAIFIGLCVLIGKNGKNYTRKSIV